MRYGRNKNQTHRSAGFALMVTLIVLLVLASLTAALATRLTMAKRRQQYMINYQRARYGLDSGIKYILSELPRTNFPLKPRDEYPDFSDIFAMDQSYFTQMITDWAVTATDEQLGSVIKEDAAVEQSELMAIDSLISALSSMLDGGQTVEPNQLDLQEEGQGYIIEIDPNDIQVPGPYGPPWPYVMEPVEMEIGPCTVRITVEDENAKMPLSWLVAPYPEDDLRVEYALETFCEWMQMNPEEIEELRAQCKDIYNEKVFHINAGPVLIQKKRSVSQRRRTVQTASQRRRTTQTAQQRPAIAHTTDFAKLFHSSLLDREKLAEPLPGTGQRVETPLKYLGLWGSQRVNINTAPRHVLQAAFMFALTWDEAVEMADAVIRQRHAEPFKSISVLKQIGLLDTATFDKLKNYMTTRSTFFKVTVTSRTANASADAVLTVVKEGSQVQTLMVLYDRL